MIIGLLGRLNNQMDVESTVYAAKSSINGSYFYYHPYNSPAPGEEGLEIRDQQRRQGRRKARDRMDGMSLRRVEKMHEKDTGRLTRQGALTQAKTGRIFHKWKTTHKYPQGFKLKHLQHSSPDTTLLKIKSHCYFYMSFSNFRT